MTCCADRTLATKQALRRDQPRGLGRGWRRTSVRMQVWSNPQAVQDYKGELSVLLSLPLKFQYDGEVELSYLVKK